MVFKWAVTTGWKGREGTFWGLAWAGAAESEPPPSKRHSWLLSRALSLAALSFLLHSFPPSPSHPSLKESHIPYIPSLALQPGPFTGFTHRKAFPQPRTRRNWGMGRRGLEKEQKAERGESVLFEGLTRHLPHSETDFILPNNICGS